MIFFVCIRIFPNFATSEQFICAQSYKKKCEGHNKTRKMERYIELSPDGKIHLRKIFNISKGMVSDTLNFKVDTDTARKIRHVALSQLGGREKVRLPIEETIHDHQGLMVQYFRNGAVLRLDKRDGTVTITNKYGDLVKEAVVSTISDFESCQELAARL